MVELGVNIDHVATVRQARRTYEPDPVWAAVEAHLGGADGITVHLREDRRHIQDQDVRRLVELTHIKLNLEMAATDEMVDIACTIKPQMAMLVPEGRHEITTEGGLDVVSQEERLRDVITKLSEAGIMSSVFIDAELAQVEAAARVGAKVCEIHTGPYAAAFFDGGRDAQSPAVLEALRKIAEAGEAITPSLIGSVNPVDQYTIDTYAEGWHTRSRINRFISRTASRMPTKIARETIA